MKTHLICQNSMTGVIHILQNKFEEDIKPYKRLMFKNRFSPCGYYIIGNEFSKNPNLTKRSKICIKCHNSLLKSHNKNLMAYMTHIKLTGETNGRLKI